MPKFIDHSDDQDGIETTYATEKQVLDFARKLRAAGGADPLDALMPSTPANAQHCLIANALNFKSTITPMRDEHEEMIRHESGAWKWVMMVPDDVNVHALAAAVDCEVVPIRVAGLCTYTVDSGLGAASKAIALPERIGNAARAFDNNKGWTKKYSKDEFEEY